MQDTHYAVECYVLKSDKFFTEDNYALSDSGQWFFRHIQHPGERIVTPWTKIDSPPNWETCLRYFNREHQHWVLPG